MGWHQRAQVASDRHFYAIVVRWLFALGAGQWRGTAAELGEVLAALVEPGRAYVPRLAGLSQKLFGIERDLRLIGWEVSFRRSNGKRLIEFQRREEPRTRSEPAGDRGCGGE